MTRASATRLMRHCVELAPHLKWETIHADGNWGVRYTRDTPIGPRYTAFTIDGKVTEEIIDKVARRLLHQISHFDAEYRELVDAKTN